MNDIRMLAQREEQHIIFAPYSDRYAVPAPHMNKTDDKKTATQGAHHNMQHKLENN